MAELVLTLGQTGSGKSFGVRTLDPESTIIINVNKTKRLPWKGSATQYNSDNNNFFELDTAADIIGLLKEVNGAEYIKTIVIDDGRYIMEREYLKKALETGYTKYTILGKNFQDIIDTIGMLRKDIVVFMNLHDEDVVNDKAIVSKKVKTVGALVDNHFNPLELVNIVLCTAVEHTKDGIEYKMYTNESVVNGIKLPAKTPFEMFDTLTIPNDFGFIYSKIQEYYS